MSVFAAEYYASYVDFQRLASDKRLNLKEVKDGLLQQAIRTVEAAVGFRCAIDLLSFEKKLIVGHNCFLDMAHVYHKFFGPLPSTAEEFVSNLHTSFPHIIDTKLLLNADYDLQRVMKKASTSLASAFCMMCPELASKRSSDLGEHSCVKVEVQVDDMRFATYSVEELLGSLIAFVGGGSGG